MTKSGAGDDRGFTLLEILVSLAVLALAIPVLMGVIGNGLRITGVTERATVAASVAEMLLARAGTEIPLVKGDRAGSYDGGFRWRLRITPFGARADRDAWPLHAYRVAVQVFWNDAGLQRVVMLTTLRLVGKEKTQ